MDNAQALTTVPANVSSAGGSPVGHGGTPDEPSSGGFGFGDIITLIFNRKWLIVSTVLAVVAIATIVVLLIPNTYEATATVLIDARKKTTAGVGKVLEEIHIDTPAVESQVEILGSKAIALKVIEKLKLREHEEFKKGRSSFHEVLSLFAVSGGSKKKAAALDEKRDWVLAAFMAKLEAKRVRNTHLIKVTFLSRSPESAARIANAIASVYVQEQLQAKVEASKRVTSFMKARLAQLRARVTEAEFVVQRFKNEHDIFDSEGQILGEKRLARLMEQNIIARNNAAQAEAKYEQVLAMVRSGRNRNITDDVLKSHTVRMLKDQLAKVTRRRAELQTKYGPRHPAIHKIGAEFREIRSLVDAEIDKLVKNLRNEFEVAKLRERTLKADLLALKRKQGGIKEETVKLRELQREAKSSRLVYEAFLARYKQTAEAQALQLPDNRVITEAVVPLRPKGPKRKQILLVAFFLGIGLGGGLAFALDHLLPGLLKKPGDGDALALEHFSPLPLIPPRAGQPPTPMRAARWIVAEPQSAFAEALRSLAHELDNRAAGPGPRVVMLASALPCEGKSLIASNLAHHGATMGRRTLLIDGDLRKATLTHALAPGVAGGLIDVLSAQAPVDKLILNDAKTNLSFLPALGPHRPLTPAAEILNGPALAATLTALRLRYDTIVIDTPPLLPVVDGRLIAAHADQIVFTMTWRRTPTALAARAIQSLGAQARQVAGVVINQVDPVEHAKNLGYAVNDAPPVTPVARPGLGQGKGLGQGLARGTQAGQAPVTGGGANSMPPTGTRASAHVPPASGLRARRSASGEAPQGPRGHGQRPATTPPPLPPAARASAARPAAAHLMDNAPHARPASSAQPVSSLAMAAGPGTATHATGGGITAWSRAFNRSAGDL
ncbi:MAG: Wzz/FepE/Etk N-terminal domain-containing protein [Pseudomonadota bacterium]